MTLTGQEKFDAFSHHLLYPSTIKISLLVLIESLSIPYSSIFGPVFRDRIAVKKPENVANILKTHDYCY